MITYFCLNKSEGTIKEREVASVSDHFVTVAQSEHFRAYRTARDSNYERWFPTFAEAQKAVREIAERKIAGATITLAYWTEILEKNKA